MLLHYKHMHAHTITLLMKFLCLRDMQFVFVTSTLPNSSVCEPD